MKGNVLIGQSGGPTAVINASLAGVIRAVQELRNTDGDPGEILGMPWAIEGYMKGRSIGIGEMSPEKLNRLARTPGSALGSCRYKLKDGDLPGIHRQLEKDNIRYLFYIGGNDTMDTIHRIETYCRDRGYELFGVGIPKTVDNDLFATDHTPGYPSAARYVALSVQQGGRLAADMKKVDQFAVFQTVGREAGWLAAASALARKNPHDAPHLIYLPEKRITREQVLSDVERVYRDHGFVYIVTGEGLLWKDGTPVSQSTTQDRFSNIEFGAMGGAGVATVLHALISNEFSFRGEFQIPESLAMASADRTVNLDRDEAFACGGEAVRRALNGESGIMVTIVRDAGSPYSVRYGTTPLEDVAVHAKPMPSEMLSHGDVTEAFIEYARPLVGPLDDYFTFDAREEI